MKQIHVERIVEAPIDKVFRTVSDVREISKALPHVIKVEVLSAEPTGVGARVRETRLMNGKESKTELRVTEFVSGEKVRMVAESGGTLWDSVFSTSADAQGTLLTLTMQAKARNWLSRLINTLIRGMISKAVERDLDLIKAFCEKHPE